MPTKHRTAASIILAAGTRRVFITLICVLAFRSTAVAQTISSWPVDPVMTAESESRILRLLGQIIDPPRGEIELGAFVKSLPSELPIAIDELALEGNGLSSEARLLPSLQRPAPVFVHLQSMLSELYCELQLKHDVLTISTRDEISQRYPVRVYDVTALTDQSRRYQIEQLQEVIFNSIDPDSWEQLGGTGTLHPQLTRNTTCLVIANSTYNHLQIDTLLNCLAGDRDYRPIFIADPRRKPTDAAASPLSRLTNFANPVSASN